MNKAKVSEFKNIGECGGAQLSATDLVMCSDTVDGAEKLMRVPYADLVEDVRRKIGGGSGSEKEIAVDATVTFANFVKNATVHNSGAYHYLTYAVANGDGEQLGMLYLNLFRMYKYPHYSIDKSSTPIVSFKNTSTGNVLFGYDAVNADFMKSLGLFSISGRDLDVFSKPTGFTFVARIVSSTSTSEDVKETSGSTRIYKADVVPTGSHYFTTDSLKQARKLVPSEFGPTAIEVAPDQYVGIIPFDNSHIESYQNREPFKSNPKFKDLAYTQVDSWGTNLVTSYDCYEYDAFRFKVIRI